MRRHKDGRFLSHDDALAADMRDADALYAEMARWIAERPTACPHGNVGDCNACNVIGDFAFDAARERAA